jgi:hypothetical protein
MIIGLNYDDPSIPIKDIQVEVRIFDSDVAEVMNHSH